MCIAFLAVMLLWHCGCRHLVTLESAEAALARVQPHIVLVCKRFLDSMTVLHTTCW
jgi:hypothetical protein